MTAQGDESPADPFSQAATDDPRREISLYFFRPPEGDWILIRSRTRAGANGAGLTMATLSDRKGAFVEVLQAMTFDRRAAQAQAS